MHKYFVLEKNYFNTKLKYLKIKNKFIFLIICTFVSFICMCIGLGMYTDLTIDGTYVTLEIVLSKSQSYFWLENVIIIFNILWPLVVTSIFIKITFEQFKKLQDKYEHLKYLKNSIIAFKAKQESLPRKNFNDLIYSRF